MKHFKLLFLSILSSLVVSSAPISSARNFSVENNDLIEPFQQNENKNDGNVKEFKIEIVNLNDKAGDFTLIHMDGEVIMIDSGGDKLNKSTAIVNDKLKDIKRIDYLIFTHGDEDHIKNFINPMGMGRWFRQEGVSVGTLIDFDIDRKPGLYNLSPLSNISRYKSCRDVVYKDKIEHHYTAYECVNSINGAKPFFQIGNNKNNGLRILDNYYYSNNCPLSNNDSTQKNLLSVGALLTYEGKKALFTGDLEEFESSGSHIPDADGVKDYKRVYGETFFAASNYKYLKDGVDFYKAAHHGSDTSNSSNLLDIIRPRFIGISTAMTMYGTEKDFKFPGQMAMTNMSKWTDYIYITSMYEDESALIPNYVPYYGDVICQYDYSIDDLILTSSEILNGKKKESLFIDQYYLDNRLIPFNIYNLSEIDTSGNGAIFTLDSHVKIHNDKDFDYNLNKLLRYFKKQKDVKGNYDMTNATYIKFGHIDILINYGARLGSTFFNYNSINKINKLCNDHELDYLILSNYSQECLRGLVDKKGLFNNTDIIKIDNFYHFGDAPFKFDKTLSKQYESIIKSKLLKDAEIKTSSDLSNQKISIFKDFKSDIELYFNFLDLPNTDKMAKVTSQDYTQYSLMFNIELEFKDYTYKYAHLGSFKTIEDMSDIQSRNATKLKDIDSLELLNHLKMINYLKFNDANQKIDIRDFLSDLGNPTILVNGYFDPSGESYTGGDQSKLNIINMLFKNIKSQVCSSTIKDLHNHKNKNLATYRNINTRLLFGRLNSDKQFRLNTFESDCANYFSEKADLYFSKDNVSY